MSSFSLPSQGGVVSLLNDVKETKNYVDKGTMQTRPTLKDRLSSDSSSAFSTIGNSIDSSSTDIGGGEKDSHSSTLSSINSGGSSLGGSESSRISEIHSLRKKLEQQNVQSTDSLGKREAADDEHDSNEEDDKSSIRKKTRSKGDFGRTTNSRSSRSHHQADQILDQARLAASPQPLEESHSGSSAGEENNKDVPMNMHKATSMSETDIDLRKVKTSPSSSSSSSRSNQKSRSGDATETNEKPSTRRRYPCSYPNCDKTFSTSGHAARHSRIHTGSKPYRCTFPGCNASFSRQDNSLQHYRTHVLHPKNRSNGGSSMVKRAASAEGSGNNTSSTDDNTDLNEETKATVRMGRKALEEGTAIAVVHEVIDGNGRRGEAVQRMVGQPRGSRRGSTSTTVSDVKEIEVPIHRKRAIEGGGGRGGGGRGGGEDVDDIDDTMSVGTNWSHSNYQRPGQSYSSHQHQHQLPSPLVYRDHSFHILNHSMTEQPVGNAIIKTSSGSAYTPSGQYPIPIYQHGSTSYSNGHDYPTIRYPSSNQFDNGIHQGSTSSLSSSPQTRRFYSATSFPMDHRQQQQQERQQQLLLQQQYPREVSGSVVVDHRRVRSFGGGSHFTRPTFLNHEQQSSISPSSAPSGTGSSLSLLFNSTSNDATANRLPLPPISKLPYSFDRSTSATSPPFDPYMENHNISSTNSFASSSPYHSQKDNRILPPLRSVLRK